MSDAAQHQPPPDMDSAVELHQRWTGSRAASQYASGRWSGPGAAGRDAQLVAGLLRRHGVSADQALDMPCGAGRLTAMLHPFARTVVGADASIAMIVEARTQGQTRGLRARAEALPFSSGAFGLVVCCRLLHHLDDGSPLVAVVRELVRVSGGWIVASYWDSACVESLARGLRKPRPRGTRRARPASALDDAFAAAGARVVARAHARRFLSPQVFVPARKQDPSLG